MSYLQTEISAFGGKPIELFKFEGTYENYYYTSATRKIVYGVDAFNKPIVYMPVPLQRTEIAAGTEQDDGLNITIDMPVTLDLIAVYGFEDSPPMLQLTIFRYHALDDIVAYWVGPISTITINDGIATVQSDSELAALLTSDFPNVYYQSPCNFVLFDARCQVIEANYSGNAVLGVVNGQTISINAIPIGISGISLDGKLIGGEIKLSSGERRMIVGQIGVVLSVNFPFSRTKLGDVVSITAGCDHAYTGDCKNKFANQRNYGGFPFIGTDNPFRDGIQDGSTLENKTCLPSVFKNVYYTITEQAPNPCNAAWVGNRWITFPSNVGKPNGVNGKDLSSHFFQTEFDSNVMYENVVRGDPRCQGQLLYKFTSSDFNNFTFEVFFPVTDTGWIIYIKPSSKYCGSVGKDEGTLQISSQVYGDLVIDQGTKAAGGLYELTWTW